MENIFFTYADTAVRDLDFCTVSNYPKIHQMSIMKHLSNISSLISGKSGKKRIRLPGIFRRTENLPHFGDSFEVSNTPLRESKDILISFFLIVRLISFFFFFFFHFSS